ncbi:hypothetical protein SAMN02745119_00155 [Trichlorobacter thiogenes]|uniref:Tetratricopeptide repeat protein n=1 Tax=Trichlorobacter thiogenes TaxID=115783 RepID=A0A1T4JXN2_9BACT|nr:hypothetical protein [Trichlorobacter thiogenes]SJZ34931.1 hypothetical protein SAMN02745119_00155 [Trichlorobacter thiogenes]
MARPLITILTALLLSMLLLIANVNHRQKTQYLEGVKGEKAGDFMVALTGYESAIRMYLPFSSRIEASATRIWALGEAAERRGDIDQALAAYRSLRSAFYGTRWLRQPGADWISRCDKKIAALVPIRKGNQP